MTVVQILEQVKRLPASDRKKLRSAILALDEKPRRPSPSKRLGEHVEWPDIEARAKKIFGDRVFPNLVLMEREESPF